MGLLFVQAMKDFDKWFLDFNDQNHSRFYCSTRRSAQKKQRLVRHCFAIQAQKQNKTQNKHARHTIWFCTLEADLCKLRGVRRRNTFPPRSALEWKTKSIYFVGIQGLAPPRRRPSWRAGGTAFSHNWIFRSFEMQVWLALWLAASRQVRIITAKWLIIHNGGQSEASLNTLPVAARQSRIISHSFSQA